MSRADLVKYEHRRCRGYGIRLVEKAFIEALLRHDGKIVPAYREAYPDSEISDSGAWDRGRGILAKERVRDYMKRAFEAKGVSPESVIGGIMEIATSGERESNRLGAYKLLGTYLKLFGMGGSGSGDTIYNLNLSYDDAQRLLGRSAKHEVGGRGEFIDVRDAEDGVVERPDSGDVSDGSDESDGLLHTDAEGLQSELAPRVSGEEAREGGEGGDIEVNVISPTEAREE